MTGTASESVARPLVWLLLGDKRGDNAQVLALGRATGWAVVEKQLHFDQPYRVPYRKRGASLDGLDQAKSSPLSEPWPDIIIGIGQRSASASRWIKNQTGGRAINIRLGRPRTSLRYFDLVISTLQYGLSKSARTMMLTLPFTRHERDEVEKARHDWHSRFAHLPKPWTTVLIGGKNARLRLDRAVIGDIVKALTRYQETHGGSLLLTTSPRTPVTAGSHLEQLLKRDLVGVPHFLYRWTAGTENPYSAMVADADTVIVTNDSVSMVADAAAHAKPLLVYALPPKTMKRKTKPFRPLIRAVCNWLAQRQEAGRPATAIDHLYTWLTRTGIVRPPRNIPIVFTRLERLGAIKPLESDVAGAPIAAHVMYSERSAVVNRIHRLYAERNGKSFTTGGKQANPVSTGALATRIARSR
ncbi:MAG: mitochondrial fission ELM1 family protein [Proteobacteria bacterium]|nr:mitochondrial fission ELM1 family protein [Pseudomonadota bacterium]